MKRIIERTETVDIDLSTKNRAVITRTEQIEEFQVSPIQVIALTFIVCFALSFAVSRQIQAQNYETYQQQNNDQYQGNL